MGRFIKHYKSPLYNSAAEASIRPERHSICLQFWIYWFTVSIWGIPGVNVAVSTTSHTLHLGVSSHCRMTLMSIWNHTKLKSHWRKDTRGHTQLQLLSQNQAPLNLTATSYFFLLHTSPSYSLAGSCPEYPALHTQCILPQSHLEFLTSTKLLALIFLLSSETKTSLTDENFLLAVINYLHFWHIQNSTSSPDPPNKSFFLVLLVFEA